MSTWRQFVVLSTFLLFTHSIAKEESGDNKLKKAISVFNIVKFRNDPCLSDDKKNGTCYTEQECQDKGGTASGSCAESYGVCCVFTFRCGQETSENCTYFMSSGNEIGACNLKINAPSNVAQLRLDFSSFVINGPSESVAKVEKLLNGVIGEPGKEVTTMGQCLTDSFSVTAPGFVAPPVICGTNDGEHMYVEASPSGNILSFQLAGTGKRTWEIKVTQLRDDFVNLAPTGCTQYFFGSKSGTFQSYNYAGALHLAKQNQNICIRREKNQCKICYSTADSATAFDVSGKGADKMGLAGKSGMCCGYGKDGMKTTGYDCVIIPGASKQADGADIKAEEFCGRQLASNFGAVGAFKTICSKVTPFQVRFLSDNYEFLAEAGKSPDGFKVHYAQSDCT